MELNWIDVKDRLPEDKPTQGHGLCHVLVCYKNMNRWKVESVYYLGNHRFVDYYSQDITDSVAYWRPFPDIPEKLKVENETRKNMENQMFEKGYWVVQEGE